MMKIRKAEIELTSLCNAACPGCRRTMLDSSGNEYEKTNIEASQVYSRFSELNLENFFVKLCGVLGDPIVHPEMLEITEWFVEKKSRVQISTNGSLRSSDYWSRLGGLASGTDQVYLHFAVDGLGDTNPVYRVKTDFKIIERNMRAYCEAGGQGAWIFIEFDHNSHQIEEAREMATSLGLEFKVRRAAKNSVFDWVVKNRKGEELHKVVKKSSQAHKEVETYKKYLSGKVENYDSKTIDCKYLHGDEIFLAATGTVWPCCFLWDEYVAKQSNFHLLVDQFHEPKWNNFYKHSFSEILNHPFYSEIEKLWHDKSDWFQNRCYRSCGAKGNLRNSFSQS